MFFGLFAKATHSVTVGKTANGLFSKPAQKPLIQVPKKLLIQVPNSLKAANELCDQILYPTSTTPKKQALNALLSSDYLKHLDGYKLNQLFSFITTSGQLQTDKQFTNADFPEAKKVKENLIRVIEKLTNKNLAIEAYSQGLGPKTYLGNIFHIQRNWFGKPSVFNKNSSLSTVRDNLNHLQSAKIKNEGAVKRELSLSSRPK